MEHNISIKEIGKVKAQQGQFAIQLKEKYRLGLTNIEGFKYLQIIWWGHLHDSESERDKLINNKPYIKGPEQLGVFATRSEFRPNPILITTIPVMGIDREKAIIKTAYIDAEDGTPVLDIKPYHTLERIKNCSVPDWCGHWPLWYEEAGAFDWEAEFNF